MKKRLLSIILALCVLCTFIPVTANAQTEFTPCHAEDTAIINPGTVAALPSGQAVPFSYTVPEDGRAILIFFSSTCGNSLSLMKQLSQLDEINTDKRTVYAFECVTSDLSSVCNTINEYAPGLMNKISFFGNGSSFLWKYVNQTADVSSITFPFIAVVEKLDGKNVITGYSTGYISASQMLYGAENIHVHNYKPGTVYNPTCNEMGYTLYSCSCGESYKGDYIDAIGHHYVNGVCTVCGDRDISIYAAKGSCFYLKSVPVGVEARVTSKGRYTNWAGISTVSQFTDENGNFCFAVQEGDSATIYKIVNGAAKKVFTVSPEITSSKTVLGTAVCDSNGYYYIVWGIENPGSSYTATTIRISKYNAKGKLLGYFNGDGSESLAYYYDVGYNTKIPFDGGNCDAAVSGNILMVNYARGMYNGHQSNGAIAINTDTMARTGSMIYYNSHSFDQRVTPYSKTGGFLLESHGDAYDRCFTTSVTSPRNSVTAVFNSFDFWVEEGADDRGNMQQLNRTYARLGNILETSLGAALIGSSARSLTSSVKTEPYDVFIQVFDPTKSASDPATYVTEGERSGYAGLNGDTFVTNYGVKWLTDFAGTKYSVDIIQAISTDDDRIVVLFNNGSSGSTYYMVLGPDGSVLKDATCIGNVSLNTDEDPVYSNGSVQWISNDDSGTELVLHTLRLAEPWNGDEKEHYTLSPDGTLTVSGIGDMPNYSGNFHATRPVSYAPWAEHSDKIKNVVIEEGITGIGIGAFYNCKNLESITIPTTLTSIGDYAFCGCDNLNNVYCTGSEAKWELISIDTSNEALQNAVKTFNYAPHSHAYTAIITPPTCTKQGYTTHTCSCGDSYIDTYTSPLGHDYGDWMQTLAPTFLEHGVEARYCSRCDAFEMREIAPLISGSIETIQKNITLYVETLKARIDYIRSVTGIVRKLLG